MWSNQIDLQLVSLLRTNRNVSKGPKASGYSIDNFFGVGHHIVDSLSTFNHLLPGFLGKLYAFVVLYDVVQLFNGESFSIDVGYFRLHFYSFLRLIKYDWELYIRLKRMRTILQDINVNYLLMVWRDSFFSRGQSDHLEQANQKINLFMIICSNSQLKFAFQTFPTTGPSTRYGSTKRKKWQTSEKDKLREKKGRWKGKHIR